MYLGNFAACLLVVLFATASFAAPPVTARIEGRVLTLHFPPNTVAKSVTLQFDGADVPKSLFEGTDPVIHWINAQDLVMNLHPVKQAIKSKWVRVVRVSGQTTTGESLLQSVDLPGKDRKPGQAHTDTTATH